MCSSNFETHFQEYLGKKKYQSLGVFLIQSRLIFQNFWCLCVHHANTQNLCPSHKNRPMFQDIFCRKWDPSSMFRDFCERVTISQWHIPIYLNVSTPESELSHCMSQSDKSSALNNLIKAADALMTQAGALPNASPSYSEFCSHSNQLVLANIRSEGWKWDQWAQVWNERAKIGACMDHLRPALTK